MSGEREYCDLCDRPVVEGLDERYACECGAEPVCKACWCGDRCISCADDIDDAAEEDW